MYQKLWKDLHAAVCSIHFYSDKGIRLNSLTGFKVAGYIVTDELVYDVPKCNEVVFRFVKPDGYSLNYEFRMSFVEFEVRINRVVEFQNEGYALIDLEGMDTSMVPSLDIESKPVLSIGQQAVIVGYDSDQDNLTIKSAIISSSFNTPSGTRHSQLDGLIKQGNFGGPLINVNSGKVIGVVAHCLTPITQSYERLKQIINENLRLLKLSEGKINFLNIDPIQVLIANQNQLKQISKDFYRTAAQSFGYAYEVSSMKEYLEDVTQTDDLQLEPSIVHVRN